MGFSHKIQQPHGDPNDGFHQPIQATNRVFNQQTWDIMGYDGNEMVNGRFFPPRDAAWSSMTFNYIQFEPLAVEMI